MKRVLHTPITQMKEVGERHQAREQMQQLGQRLLAEIGKPKEKKQKLTNCKGSIILFG